MPPEYCEISWNDMALSNGIEDISNKLIIRYRYNYKTEKIEPFRVYGYSDSLIHNLKTKLRIPVYDMTTKQTEFPIIDEINLNEVNYIKKWESILLRLDVPIVKKH